MPKPLLLIRHAKAGARHQWHGDDGLRPLSGKGQRQAKGLVKALSPFKPEQILSSPSVRCGQTVQPLAEALGLAIDETDDLLEGNIEEGIRLARKLLGSSAALCTHGDIIPAILETLVPGLPEPLLCAKGSTWILERGNREVHARYIPPTS
jgi:phosphohistidine phosphatase SixA